MGLVELRERMDEPAVRALLEAAHRGSLEAAVDRYRARDWVLVGWEEDGVLVASACVERVTSEEIRLRSVAVAPERRARGIGRALVGALAEVAAARRLVAETDADSSGFYQRCGFAVEPAPPTGGRARFRCTRVLEPQAAAPEAVSAATLGGLEGAIRESWGRDTSDDPDEWSEENPARGQCVVTAMLLRDLLGGEILIANVLREGVRVERHAWNRLPSGLAVDLTRSQFRRGETLEEPAAGEPVTADRARCELLSQRVRERLGAGPLA